MYGQGKSFVFPAVVIYVKKNNVGYNRVGITTSVKIGTAVERNRARRVIRAAYRCTFAKLNGVDTVFVARRKTTFCKMQVVEKCMQTAMNEFLKMQ